jgi:hypothetical protein
LLSRFEASPQEMVGNRIERNGRRCPRRRLAGSQPVRAKRRDADHGPERDQNDLRESLHVKADHIAGSIPRADALL